MNMDSNPVRLKAAATYNAAADHFDAGPLAFWDRHGRRAVALAELRSGERVLDVGCGTGASALPAASAVGPEGAVLGMDVAEKMLGRARAKADGMGLTNVEFRLADMAASGESDGRFDAVLSVFSVFLVPDMERQVAELWRMLRPGGRLVVTVWGQRSFEPAVSVFAEELKRLRPDLPAMPRPWERLTLPEGLRQMLLGGGAADPRIHPAPDRQRLAAPADWWTIALGSGFRWEIDQLEPKDRTILRTRTLKQLSDGGVDSVETSALHAVATRF